MDRRAFLRRTAPLALVGLAGCTGGDGTPTPEDSPTPTATEGDSGSDGSDETPTATDESADTPTAEPTDSPTDEPTDSPTPTEESTPTPQPDTEVIVGPGGSLRFEPKSFTISAGDTVLWRWDSPGHNVSPADGGQPSGANWEGKDEEFGYPEGTTHVHTFDTTGEYQYHCDPHQTSGMTGAFTVE